MTLRGRLASALWIPLAAIAALALIPAGSSLSWSPSSVPAVAHRDAIWRSISETFANDWSDFWRRDRSLQAT